MKKILITIIIIFIIIISIICGMLCLKSKSKPEPIEQAESNPITEPSSKQKQELNLSSEQEAESTPETTKKQIPKQESDSFPEAAREPIPGQEAETEPIPEPEVEPTQKQSEQDIEKMEEKASNLKRDIVIDTVSKSETMESTGAYSESYDVISLEDKKLYHIYYHGFLGEEPDRYSILEKDLTQEQIEQLTKLENMESEEIHITEDERKGRTSGNNYYWKITYKGKQLKFNELPFPKEILDIN